ncbi:hypothetical protein [Marinobacterium lutimaris]|uniref:Uncharacterized protein n=1 Tax=Marinobacterium lutimaris TaxID=568106 RepID=A0A1H5Z288_9GAMM|nr:hypothetical protein [Marinobacterium lutimaris]SEG29777.1 hypothetical protein SAMN05444390_1011966 [Marinobacterium lutimaris]
MADINEYISKAALSEAARPGAKPIKPTGASTGKKLSTLLLWGVVVALVFYEAGYWMKTLGIHGGPVTAMEIDSLYDEAQQELERRFIEGLPMTAPFSSPVLVATIGVVEESYGRYLLYYLDRSRSMVAREVFLTRE